MQFNETDKNENRTTNHAGGEAFEPESPELALYKVVVNNLLEDTYYADDQEMFDKVVKRADAMADEDPEFVLKLAAYARQEMGLRQVPQLLLAFAANDDRFKVKPPTPGHHEISLIRDYAPEIIQRMDETATVRAANDMFDGGDPWALRQGVGDAIIRHEDDYVLSKYRMESRQYTLYDMFNWSHPKPENADEDDRFGVQNRFDLTDEELAELNERFMLGNLDDHEDVSDLEPPETWEVIVSEMGNTADAWRQALDRMGHMAKLMNLRNMVEAGLSGDEIVSDDDLNAAKGSRTFLFRYYSAFKALQDAGIHDKDLHEFLEDAIDANVESVPDTLGNSYAVADISGSMSNVTVSGRSERTPHEIAAFFTAILGKKGARIGAFADNFEEVSAHPYTPALELTDKIRKAGPGGGTNAWKVLRHLTQNELEFERVILLTDDQFWDSTSGFGRSREEETVKHWWDKYTSEVAPEATLYNIDLSAYGSLAFPEGYDNVYRINGWNERVVDFVVNAEQPNEVIEQVRNYDPVE